MAVRLLSALYSVALVLAFNLNSKCEKRFHARFHSFTFIFSGLIFSLFNPLVPAALSLMMHPLAGGGVLI